MGVFGAGLRSGRVKVIESTTSLSLMQSALLQCGGSWIEGCTTIHAAFDKETSCNTSAHTIEKDETTEGPFHGHCLIEFGLNTAHESK